MKNKLCSFCQLDLFIEFYYYDRRKNIIICRDKFDKHRLLAVRVGQENHKPMPTVEERTELLTPLIAVAEAQVKNGQITGYYTDEIVNSEHYHYYAILKGGE